MSTAEDRLSVFSNQDKIGYQDSSNKNLYAYLATTLDIKKLGMQIHAAQAADYGKYNLRNWKSQLTVS